MISGECVGLSVSAWYWVESKSFPLDLLDGEEGADWAQDRPFWSNQRIDWTLLASVSYESRVEDSQSLKQSRYGNISFSKTVSARRRVYSSSGVRARRNRIAWWLKTWLSDSQRFGLSLLTCSIVSTEGKCGEKPSSWVQLDIVRFQLEDRGL